MASIEFPDLGAGGSMERAGQSREPGDGTGSRPLPAPAIAAPRNVPGKVSVITPTYNRDGSLRNALACFRQQTHDDTEWLVLDDSTREPSALRNLEDRNVFYEHVAGRLSIGEKRNILIEKARGETIVQFDDDDYYAPDYVRAMVASLADLGADLINLRGWFLYDRRSGFFGYWDLMQKEGLHYRCDQAGVAVMALNPQNNGGLRDAHFGYGFSYAFRRRVWEAVKFPEIDWNEDGEFSLRARSRFRVDGFQDTRGVCLHLLHPASTSRCFPQHHLPNFLLRRLFPACPASAFAP
jgi:glycosyltransferase involved in cell wall biosynthesis